MEMSNNKNHRRRISSYSSSYSTVRQRPRRTFSVPNGSNCYEDDNGDIVDGGVSGQILPPGVLDCLLDAYGTFSEIYQAVIKQPKVNFQPRLSDAEILLPDIAYLVNDKKPDALQTVNNVLVKIKQRCPNQQQQNMCSTLKAIQNAMVILHTDGHDLSDVDIDPTQPRNVMAAVMIINEYLTNLIYP